MSSIVGELTINIEQLKAKLAAAEGELKAFKKKNEGHGNGGAVLDGLEDIIKSISGGVGSIAELGGEAGGKLAMTMAAGMGAAAGVVGAAVTEVITKAIEEAAEAAKMAAELIAKGIEEGLKFNLELSDIKEGIANTVGALQKLDSGKSHQIADAALAQIKEIEKANAAGFNTIAQGFLGTQAAANHAGLTIRQNIDLVAKFSNALKNTGQDVSAERIMQELRNTLEGQVGPRHTHLAYSLGITNKNIEDWKEAGTIYQELSKRLGTLGGAGDAASVSITSMHSAFQQAMGDLTKPLFDQLIEGAQSLTQIVNSPEFKAWIEVFAKELGALAKQILSNTPLIMHLAESFMRLGAIGLAQIKVLTPLLDFMLKLANAASIAFNMIAGGGKVEVAGTLQDVKHPKKLAGTSDKDDPLNRKGPPQAGDEEELKKLRKETSLKFARPEQSMEYLRQMLSNELGVPIHNMGDLGGAFKKLQGKADKARSEGDGVTETGALKKLKTAQDLAEEMGGHESQASAAGETRGVLNILTGQKDNLVVQESQKHTAILQRIENALQRIAQPNHRIPDPLHRHDSAAAFGVHF